MKHPERPVTVREGRETVRVACGTARSDLLHLAEQGYVEKRATGKEFVFLYRRTP